MGRYPLSLVFHFFTASTLLRKKKKQSPDLKKGQVRSERDELHRKCDPPCLWDAHRYGRAINS